MTLIDTAERLSVLAGEASAAADAGSLEAALREVRDRLDGIGDASSFGILEAEWWSQVPTNEQESVRTAARQAAEVVGPLVAESDHVLAAYGRGGGQADRGAFGGLLRVFRDYAGAVGRAQDTLIQTWRDALWSIDQRAELDVHALVPETADTAREVLGAVDALNRAVEAGRPLAGDALRALDEQCQSAREAATQLGVVRVPETVLTFFTEVAEQTTVPLNAISPDVFAWLDEHDATRLFVVGRAD